MQTLILEVPSMVRVLENGTVQVFMKGEPIDVPTDHVQRVLEKRIAKRPEQSKK